MDVIAWDLADVRDHDNDVREQRRGGARRRLSEAVAHANATDAGTPEFRGAMVAVREAQLELDRLEAERPERESRGS